MKVVDGGGLVTVSHVSLPGQLLAGGHCIAGRTSSTCFDTVVLAQLWLLRRRAFRAATQWATTVSMLMPAWERCSVCTCTHVQGKSKPGLLLSQHHFKTPACPQQLPNPHSRLQAANPGGSTMMGLFPRCESCIPAGSCRTLCLLPPNVKQRAMPIAPMASNLQQATGA